MKRIQIIVLGFLLVSICTAQKVEVETAEQGNSMFAFELYQQLSKTKENVFFSPFSISSALSMTYVGAAGTTAEEMKNTLHFLENSDSCHSEFNILMNKIPKKSKDKQATQISIANSLWAQKDFHFEDVFLKTVKSNYNTPVEMVDFIDEKNRGKTREKINKYVASQTNNKIKDLIGKKILDKTTRLVLVNAIYFKGNWSNPFKEAKTKKKDFFISSKKTVQTDFMQGIFGTHYFENEDVQIAALPYEGRDATMLIFLPKNKDGFNDLQEKFTHENFTEWNSKLKYRKVAFTIPKFKIEESFDLEKVLKKMGMKSAFGKKADFSGMNKKNNLYLSKVLHKAFIEVDEAGTEATAATAIVLNRKSASTNNKPPVIFRADQPFIFMIRENSTNSILFIGHYVNP